MPLGRIFQPLQLMFRLTMHHRCEVKMPKTLSVASWEAAGFPQLLQHVVCAAEGATEPGNSMYDTQHAL
jgi:hypothetical protein